MNRIVISPLKQMECYVFGPWPSADCDYYLLGPWPPADPIALLTANGLDSFFGPVLASKIRDEIRTRGEPIAVNLSAEILEEPVCAPDESS